MDHRTSKSIADRVDTRFHHRPNPKRRLIRSLCLGGLLITSGMLVLAESWDNRRIYMARPVSDAHAVFADDCQVCHRSGWATWDRLRFFDSEVVATSDAACTACHIGPRHHSMQIVAHETVHCARCHREHANDRTLTHVADRDCLRCHRDLPSAVEGTLSFMPRISEFDHHPEFALHRDRISGDTPGTAHLAALESVARPDGTGWQDRSTIRFNHQVHLRDEIRNPDGSMARLTCNQCHATGMNATPFSSDGGSAHAIRATPQRDGRNHLPVTYEQHCARCHSNLLVVDVQHLADRAVPHGDASQAAGVLRQWYAELLAANPEITSQSDPLVDDPMAMPGAAPRLTRDGWRWVEERIENAHRVLFGQRDGGCRYCHTQVSLADNVWQVSPQGFPRRWLEFGEFRHDTHRMWRCVECHDANESRLTSDILLPKIAICRQCHRSGPKTGLSGAAKSDCVECHKYHHRTDEDTDVPLSVENFLPEGGLTP